MCSSFVFWFFFFFKQKTAYEMRISDWSSDVCSSDLNWWTTTRLRATRSGRSACFVLYIICIMRNIRWSTQASVTSDMRGLPSQNHEKIGRASCRERVCQYVSISVVAVSLKKKEYNYIE